MPAPPQLRPRSPGEVVDAAFQILRAHYAPLLTCSAIGYLPLVLLRLLVVGDPLRFLDGDVLASSRNLMWASGVVFLGSWLTVSMMSAVMLVCTAQAYMGEPVDVGTAIRTAMPRVPQVLVAAALRFVLICIGFVLLLAPALWVVAALFAVTPVIVLERAGVWAAMRRSATLSTGRKWHVLSTLGLVAIIYYLLVGGVSIFVSLLGNVVVTTVVSSLATVLVYPVVAITEALLYYDARIKDDGLDIDPMAGALAAGAPASATP